MPLAGDLEPRLKGAHLGRFKPLADFDWQWPGQCDRQAVEELMHRDFIEQTAHAVLVGPNGVGKSTIARNIASQAVLAVHTVRFTSAAQMHNELAAQDGGNALRCRRLALYARPRLLVIDEVGYLSCSNRHADLLFEIFSRRYEEKSTLITTNRPFAEWNQVFPNSACVVSLIDRLVHHAEIIQLEGADPSASKRLSNATSNVAYNAPPTHRSPERIHLPTNNPSGAETQYVPQQYPQSLVRRTGLGHLRVPRRDPAADLGLL